MGTPDREVAHDYLRWLDEAPRAAAARRRAGAPIGPIQTAARTDPDPFVRARCLGVLDHVGNEESTHVFAAALQDPVADVRRHAVHGLTCERCRRTDVCPTDVVPAIIDALARERDGEIRHQLVVVLSRFAGRDEHARRALEAVATSDQDLLLRTAASAVVATGHTRSRKALARLARTTARRRRSTAAAPG